jgi:hypothetical protein
MSAFTCVVTLTVPTTMLPPRFTAGAAAAAGVVAVVAAGAAVVAATAAHLPALPLLAHDREAPLAALVVVPTCLAVQLSPALGALVAALAVTGPMAATSAMVTPAATQPRRRPASEAPPSLRVAVPIIVSLRYARGVVDQG